MLARQAAEDGLRALGDERIIRDELRASLAALERQLDALRAGNKPTTDL